MSKHNPRPKPLPSAKYLRECFAYDPINGLLTWKIRPAQHFENLSARAKWNGACPGKIAGGLQSGGYLVVNINHERFLVHRVIWKLVTGKEPEKSIDHINGKRADNRWANFRLATTTEQKRNTRMYKNNTSGHRGIYLSKNGKWKARISLGTFFTREEAAAAWQSAARMLHGEFYRE